MSLSIPSDPKNEDGPKNEYNPKNEDNPKKKDEDFLCHNFSINGLLHTAMVDFALRNFFCKIAS